MLLFGLSAWSIYLRKIALDALNEKKQQQKSQNNNNNTK